MKRKKRPPAHIGKPLTHKQKWTLKKKLFIEQDGKCSLCGQPVTVDSGNLDHDRPFSKGGENYAFNLTLTHFECNTKKGSKIPDGMVFA